MKKKKLMGQRLAAIVLCCAMTFSQSMPVYGLQTEAVKADSENSVSQGNVENSNEMMLESDMEGSEDGSYLVDLDSTSETGSVLDNDKLDDRVKNIELETVAEKQAEVEASREFANESKSLVDFVNELDSKRDSLDSAEILTSEEVSATESQGIENVGDDTEDGSAEVSVVDKSKIEVKELSNGFSITSSDTEDIYVAVVKTENVEGAKFWTSAALVAPSKTRSVYVCYENDPTDESGISAVRKAIEANTSYTIFYSRYRYLSPSEDSTEVPRDEYTTKAPSEDTVEYKDGYKEIAMNAVIQKDKTVKITWKPSSKDETQKQFKKYVLYQLSADETDWNKIYEGTGKNFKSKNTYDASDDEPVYLLECLDSSGKKLASYITVAAPYFCFFENGYSASNFTFTFAHLSESASMSYRLETAMENKENTDKGWKDDWSYIFSSSDVGEIGTYPIGKNKDMKITRATYINDNNDKPEIKVNQKYFGRVKSVYWYQGKQYTSAPSNVINRKSGPAQVYIYRMTGIKYDEEDAKKYDNKTNMAYVAKYVEEVIATGEEPEDVKDDSGVSIFVHPDDHGVDAKTGTVFFLVNDTTKIKAFELMTCDQQYGNYKKLKTYNLNNAKDKLLCWKCDITGTEIEAAGYSLWCLRYNKFTPEKTAFYAVRAVSETGSVPGGTGYSIENTVYCDKVQWSAAVDSGIDSITLIWNHDDCVKQYWVYRAEKTSSLPDDADITDTRYIKIGQINGNKVVKETIKIDGRVYTAIYHKFIDKVGNKNALKPDTDYAYIVRPVYDTKKAKEDISYNLADCSEPAVGSATSTFSEVKSLTATNYSTGKIQLKWNLLKLITKYNIERIEVTEGGSTPSADDSNWKLIHSFPSDGKKTSQATYIDETAIPGQYYYYRIQPATDKSESVNKTATKQSVVSIPLSLTGLTAHYYSGNTGAKLTWGYNSKEADTKYQTRVEVTYGNESFYEVTTDAATSCIDYTKLSSGSERSYKVTPIYYYTDPASGNTREVRGKTQTVAYSKPSEIGFYDKDYNEISSYELYVGESTTIRGYALISKDGRKAATVRGLSYSVSGDACNISKGEEDDHSNFNIEAKNAGEVTLTVWADCNSNIRKSIKIKVKKR